MKRMPNEMSETDQTSGEEPAKTGFPAPLLAFLSDQGIDPKVYDYADSLPRFLRVNPRWNEEESMAMVQRELGCRPEKLEWLPGFYSLNKNINIASCKAYKEGRIYGIDASSGAAVVALDPAAGDNVLELCTAPGGKLCMIGDMLNGCGSATGVDNSQERSGACRNVLRKYAVPCCRLFRGDATTFTAPPPDLSKTQEFRRSYGPQRKKNRKQVSKEEPHALIWDSCSRASQILVPYESFQQGANPHCSSLSGITPSIGTTDEPLPRGSGKCEAVSRSKDDVARSEGMEIHHASGRGSMASPCSGDHEGTTAEVMQAPGELLYDRVLVDAECTHDGSFRHMEKFKGKAWEEFRDKFLSRMEGLQSLQRKLLQQGFRLLKEGGVLVYSTCSMTRTQNEDVIQWLLDTEGGSAVPEEINQARMWPCSSGGVQHSIRLDPIVSNTSALFICKIRRRISRKDGALAAATLSRGEMRQ